jgi:hypothetical protein
LTVAAPMPVDAPVEDVSVFLQYQTLAVEYIPVITTTEPCKAAKSLLSGL